MRRLWMLVVAGGLVFALLPPERQATAKGTSEPSTAPRCQDDDGDGYGLGCSAGPDCNDRDATISPNQPERCNFRDDDCNALVDDAPACKAPALDRRAVKVPAGRLLMGSAPGEGGAPDEQPRHRVRLSSFHLDRHEVTNRRYRACVMAGRCSAPQLTSSHLRTEYFGNPAYADYPVIFVGWNQAQSFCRWTGGRLPTEAEWEMAARGPTPSVRKFPWGAAPADCSRANMGGAGSCVNDTDRVGRRLAGASPCGALDLAGNVWEWVADWYDAGYYARSAKTNPTGPGSGTLKVVRGGCWVSGQSSLRVSCRKAELPATWAYNVGFRCAYDKDPAKRKGVR